MLVKINGKPFEVAEEPKDFWGWVEKGIYALEWKTLDKHLKPEHTFLDLGAWVGSHSLYASQICKRVVAVEPDPVAYKILQENTKGLIETHSVAIAGYSGEIRLGSGWLGASTTRANPNAGGGIGAWEKDHVFTINCLTFKEFCEDFKITGPLFVKVDIEGVEEEILLDLLSLPVGTVIYLEIHPWWWIGDEKSTREEIAQLGTAELIDRNHLLIYRA